MKSNDDYIEVGDVVFAKRHIVYVGIKEKEILVQPIYGQSACIKYTKREECLDAYKRLVRTLRGNGGIETDCVKTAVGNAISYKAVDLGLPSGLLWADRNIGASEPEEYGKYFAWGDTVGYGQDTSDGHLFNGDNCPWGESTPPMSTLDAEHDAATINMGADWRMPDIADFEELLDNCTTKWTTQNGIKGMLFTSKHNGNTLFFPAAGLRGGSLLKDAGYFGDYWTRSHYTSNLLSAYAYALSFNFGNCYVGIDGRCFGYSVRGVTTKTEEGRDA